MIDRTDAPTPAPADEPEEQLLFDVLGEAVDVLEAHGIRYLVMGGIASALLGRPRWTRDVDLFMRPQDASHAMPLLERAGFETRVEYPTWLYKAFKHDVLVDVIFRSSGEIYLDEEMLERAQRREFGGRVYPIVPAEDLVVMKAIAHSEETPRYWFDALSVLAREEVDWDYLIRRALRHGGRRILSLLFFAQSRDIVVPEHAVRTLFDQIYEEARTTVGGTT